MYVLVCERVSLGVDAPLRALLCVGVCACGCVCVSVRACLCVCRCVALLVCV